MMEYVAQSLYTHINLNEIKQQVTSRSIISNGYSLSKKWPNFCILLEHNLVPLRSINVQVFLKVVNSKELLITKYITSLSKFVAFGID